MMRWWQTDFRGIIREDGCLVFSLLDGCYEGLIKMGRSPRDLTKSEIEELLHHAHRRGWIQKGRRDEGFGMYVMDHGGLANEMLSWLLEPEIRCSYLAAEYMPGEAGESWGSPEENDMIILQVRTKNGGGHFRRPCFDPWEPSPGIARVRSVRYYRFFQM